MMHAEDRMLAGGISEIFILATLAWYLSCRNTQALSSLPHVFSLRCFPFVTFEDARSDDTTTPTTIYPLPTCTLAQRGLGGLGVEIKDQRC